MPGLFVRSIPTAVDGRQMPWLGNAFVPEAAAMFGSSSTRFLHCSGTLTPSPHSPPAPVPYNPGMALLINGERIDDAVIDGEFSGIKAYLESLGNVSCCERDPDVTRLCHVWSVSGGNFALVSALLNPC